MIVNLPGGSSVDVDEGTTGVIDDRGALIRLHLPQSLSRLIAYWHDKPNMQGLLASYINEIQELENVLHQVLLLRTPDYAGTAQLNVLGSIVDEERNGLDNPDYLLRIKARIRANSSYGTGADVIAVLRLITEARFHFQRTGTASFLINFVETPSDAVIKQAGSLVDETKAAGVGFDISMPVSTLNARYGTVQDLTLNQHSGYGSIYDLTNSPRYGHTAT